MINGGDARDIAGEDEEEYECKQQRVIDLRKGFAVEQKNTERDYDEAGPKRYAAENDQNRVGE